MKYTITILEHKEVKVQGNVKITSSRKVLSVGTDKSVVAEVKRLLEEA